MSMILRGRDPASGRPLKATIEGERIVAIGEGDDDEGVYLAPGLIDLQVNGYEGHDVNEAEPRPETLVALALAMRRVGVTTFLPTIITSSEEHIIAGLRAIAAARAEDVLCSAMIPFAHVEGPFLSPDDGPRGAHPRAHVRPLDIAEVRRWQDASGGLVGLLTISPHDADAPAFIRESAALGVRVALGHTHATGEQIRAAADAGATLSTHLGNGAAAMLPRHPNFIWAQLAEDRLAASFIADGHHLPADAFTAMLRAKGLDRALLVSDATALGGMPPGVYDQPIGGRVELTAEGRLGTVGTPYLAGAARPLKDGVAIAARMANLSLSDALRLATENPGRFVGDRGRLGVGARADLVQFAWKPGDATLDIRRAIVSGRELR